MKEAVFHAPRSEFCVAPFTPSGDENLPAGDACVAFRRSFPGRPTGTMVSLDRRHGCPRGGIVMKTVRIQAYDPRIGTPEGSWQELFDGAAFAPASTQEQTIVQGG
jgi:hypothetical protein